MGNKVMLSMLHQRREYKKKSENRVTKFFPRFDGPFETIDAHALTSNYTLDLPNSPNVIGKVQLVNIYSYSPVFVFELLINPPEHIATATTNF
jgi:hypothetical protein